MRSARWLGWGVAGHAILCALASGCGGGGKGACLPAGSYPISTDDPAQACCSGLTRLDVGSAGYLDSALTMRICSPAQGTDRTYGCLMGTCGDGICEGAEAVPCGCPADCPSAVWGATSSSEPIENVDAQAACSEVGVYTHLDGVDTPPPCCAGLFRLEVRVPHLVNGDQRACFQDDPLSFACLVGACGDGKCEAPEAVPCVCPPDCPSAVWEQEDASVTSTP